MAYQFLKIEKETYAGKPPAYVALVAKDGEDQPFRIVLNNFESADEAMAQVDRWIKVQEEDEANGRKEAEAAALESKQDSIIAQINQS